MGTLNIKNRSNCRTFKMRTVTSPKQPAAQNWHRRIGQKGRRCNKYASTEGEEEPSTSQACFAEHCRKKPSTSQVWFGNQ